MKHILILIGSFIFLYFGAAHLYLTFFSDKFLSRNSEVEDAMKITSPIITSQTTMWKAWVGFNASHSLGAMFFGLINIILILKFKNEISDSYLIQIVNLLFCFSFVLLGYKYWFKTPFLGIVSATVCFVIGYLIGFFE